METTDSVPVQTVPSVPSQNQEPTKNLGIEKPFIYVLIIVVFLFSLFLILIFLPKKSPQPEVQNTPSPTFQASPSPFQQNLSEFSQTEPFKLFEGRLEAIRLENEGVNLSETELAFPLLDMDVTFSNR